jgi:5-methyltetrahydrofolate corrinoid/iron sulfur protein methyltransferase
VAIEKLAIIGESINDSVPSTKKLFAANDIEGLENLAKLQDERGAAYIDVNVGERSPEFMAEMIKRVQAVTTKPLSIDTPDQKIARAGLEAYDPQRADGAIPIINSISPLRPEMFDLYAIQAFKPILLISERQEGGVAMPCRTAEETYETARDMLRMARDCGDGIPNDDLIFDPGIAPVGADSEDNLKRLIDAMQSIHDDAEFAGVHMSVGLSNFTVMLPAKRADGSPVKSALESAFLTRAMPRGLDMVIGSVKRNYQLLEPGHPALDCVDDVLRLGGFEAIMRVQEFYSE